MYSIGDLEAFTAVARFHGVSQAARALNIAPATVSHRISKLEHALRITLFYRTSRALTLTDEGRIFYERVEAILADLRQAEQEAGSGTTQLRGHLRVTMSPWILSRFIMPKLATLRQAHPDLTLEFLAVDRMVALAEEGQDCAIRVGQLADSALRAQKLCDNDRLICASPDFLNRYGVPKTFEHLADAPWVSLPWQQRIDVTDAGGRKRTIRLARNVEVSSSSALTDGAANGLGLAIKSRLAIKRELDEGVLVEVLPGRLHSPEAPVWFVYPAEVRTGRKLELFRNVSVEAFSVV